MRTGQVVLASALLTLGGWGGASAQTTGTTEGLPLGEAIVTGAAVAGGVAFGDAIAFGTRLEVSTAPLGTGAGGFSFVLDPETGLVARTANTFGPAFAERVIMTGEGKLSVGVNLLVATYDKIGDRALDLIELGSTTATNPQNAFQGTSSMVLSSQTLVLFGSMGVRDDLDLGVAVPLIKIDVDSISSLTNGFIAPAVPLNCGPSGPACITPAGPEVVALRTVSGRSSGMGDLALSAKYRLLAFGEGDVPDPGGLGVLVRLRLPTGDSANLRGLGVTRTLVSFLYSSGTGRMRPHVNVGYEWWSKGVSVKSGSTGADVVIAKNQFEYAAGVELEATPRLTLLFDLLGRHVLGGGGSLGSVTRNEEPNRFGITSRSFLTTLSDDIRKLTIVPGVRWNVRGKLTGFPNQGSFTGKVARHMCAGPVGSGCSLAADACTSIAPFGGSTGSGGLTLNRAGDEVDGSCAWPAGGFDVFLGRNATAGEPAPPGP